MNGRVCKLVSFLLTLVLLVGVTVTAAGAQNGVKLEFIYPEDVPQEAVTLTVHKGVPTGNGGIAKLEKLELIAPAEDGSYVVPEVGSYTYWVRGDGYYNVFKIFNVTEADMAAGVKKLDVLTGKMAYEGYEPSSPLLKNVPADYDQGGSAVISIYSDEINRLFTTEGLRDVPEYRTPYFTNERADHEFTSQQEMMDFIRAKDAASGNMYTYNLGNSPLYGYEIPFAVFTATDLSGAKTLEEAGKLVRANGKLNIWYQAQIHPSEPAAGEAALVLIDELAGAYGEKVLADANIIVTPRINPDSSYLFMRKTYQGFDMNRDNMVLKAPELAYTHTAYRYFMPEVVVDGHEFEFYGVKNGFVKNVDDLQVSPASSLNNDATVNRIATEVVDVLHKNLMDTGIRVYHYGTTVTNTNGRAFYGLYNSVSILVESRGIAAGAQNFVRRVYSQQQSIHSIIDASIARAEEIRSAVAAARADVVKKGAAYEQEDVVVLHQDVSGDFQSPTPLPTYSYSLDGIESKVSQNTLPLQDTVVRSRPRPTAYVIPKDIQNVEQILYILDNQGVEYYELAPGSAAMLEQYYYVGEYLYKDKNTGSIADLRAAANVVFPKGAYVIPMDQVSGNVIAMLMEPDVNDSKGLDGTLVQSGIVAHDTDTMNYPIYRYTGNDPRTTLVSNTPASEPAPEQKPEPAPEVMPEPEKTDALYTVKPGDSLWKIAKAQLGSGIKWGAIYKANKGIIKNPNKIYAGQVLVIPVL